MRLGVISDRVIDEPVAAKAADLRRCLDVVRALRAGLCVVQLG